jgi:hypothetical protein
MIHPIGGSASQARSYRWVIAPPVAASVVPEAFGARGDDTEVVAKRDGASEDVDVREVWR